MSQSQTEDAASIGVVVDLESLSDPEGPWVILVKDEGKPNSCWKLVGGMHEPQDVDPKHRFDETHTAVRAFRREMHEEVGATVESLAQIVYLSRQIMPRTKDGKRHVHTKWYFLALADCAKLRKIGGDDDEVLVVKRFRLNEVESMQNFFPLHLPIVRAGTEKLRELIASVATNPA